MILCIIVNRNVNIWVSLDVLNCQKPTPFRFPFSHGKYMRTHIAVLGTYTCALRVWANIFHLQIPYNCTGVILYSRKKLLYEHPVFINKLQIPTVIRNSHCSFLSRHLTHVDCQTITWIMQHHSKLIPRAILVRLYFFKINSYYRYY